MKNCNKCIHYEICVFHNKGNECEKCKHYEERMNNTKELLKLIAENLDLPIIPLVDSEVVPDDDYGRYLGSFGSVYVGEFAIFNDRYYDEREDFKEHFFDYCYDELSERFNYDPRDETENKELEKYLDEIADKYFIKAIIVNIDLPDC